MDRRQFLQSMAALFGAVTLPESVLANALLVADNVPVQMPKVQRAMALKYLHIGGTFIDFDGSIIVPAGSTPEVVFFGNVATLRVDGNAVFATNISPREDAYTYDIAWYELDADCSLRFMSGSTSNGGASRH